MKSRLHQLALACFGAVEIMLHGFGYCLIVTDFGRAHDPSPDSPRPGDNRRVLWLTRFWIGPRLMAARSTSRSLLCSREPRGRRRAYRVRRRHQSAGQSEIDGAGGIVSCPKHECACAVLKVAPSERLTFSTKISAILASIM